VFICKGQDEHFDKEIYERYGHERLIRAFVPIIAPDPSGDIGTLEAGYNIERRNFIEDRQIMMLKALADQAAIAIRNRTMQDELIRTERLQLMPDMAHILKSPAGQLSMLLKGIERELVKADSDETMGNDPHIQRLKDYVDLAKRAVFSIETTSRTLYMEIASRVQPQEKDRIEIIDLLRRLIEKFLYSERIKLETEIPQCCLLLMTQTECTSLEFIILNLLDNAVKFSPLGSRVQVICYVEKNDVCVSVINRGPGILLQDLPHIFEPGFHTIVKGWPEGTGMGLYTVQRLLHQIGWSCEVDNRVGYVRFVVRIPGRWRMLA
jgi:signal transduction histidine kinase